MDIDEIGLDSLDLKYIQYIHTKCNDGPVGIETIVAGISEDIHTVEDVIESYLLQIGFIMKSPKVEFLTKIA